MPSRRVASTGWITDPVIPFDDLRRADLGEVWVAQDVEGTTADAFAMTDGRTYVWAYRHDDGHATYQVYAEHANEQPGENPVRDAVEEAFQVEWVSEHQDEFWSEEERAEQDAQAERDEAEDWEPEEGGEGPKGSTTVHSDLSSRTPFLRMALAMTEVRTADAPDPPGGLLEALEEWLREAEGDLEVIAMASQTVDEARRAFERADLPPTEWDASLRDVRPDLSATYEFRDHGDGGWNVDVTLSRGGTEVATVPMVEAGTGREALLAEALSAAGL